ncbi:MAG: hypothetical protein EZS28_006150, partial [Streblomastix strix]
MRIEVIRLLEQFGRKISEKKSQLDPKQITEFHDWKFLHGEGLNMYNKGAQTEDARAVQQMNQNHSEIGTSKDKITSQFHWQNEHPEVTIPKREIAHKVTQQYKVIDFIEVGLGYQYIHKQKYFEGEVLFEEEDRGQSINQRSSQLTIRHSDNRYVCRLLECNVEIIQFGAGNLDMWTQEKEIESNNSTFWLGLQLYPDVMKILLDGHDTFRDISH